MYGTDHLCEAHRKEMRLLRKRSQADALARLRQEKTHLRTLALLKQTLAPAQGTPPQSTWGKVLSALMYLLP